VAISGTPSSAQRSGTLRDPFGHEWTTSQELEWMSPDEMQRRWNAMVSAPGNSTAA
jgi:PhnB protein